MKIVHIVRTSKGGMLSHIKILLKMLSSKGRDNISIIGDFDDKTKDEFLSEGISVYNVKFNNDKNIFSLLICVIKVAKILRKEMPDVVHMHGYIASIVGGLACILTKNHNTVVTVHNFLPEHGYMRRFLKLFEGNFSKYVKIYIAVSNSLKDYIIKEFNIPENKVHVVYNGIFDNNKSLINVRKEFSVKKVITIARLIPQKGVKSLIQAADKILNMRSDVEFIIVGDGPQRAELEALVQKTGKSDHIKFLGFRNDTDKLLEESDIFVLPSRSEGMPVSCIEAMRAKRPIIATRVGGIPEEVIDGLNGILIEPEDIDGLCNAINIYLDNPLYAQKCGENGYKMYKKHFSADEMFDNTCKLYGMLINGNKMLIDL